MKAGKNKIIALICAVCVLAVLVLLGAMWLMKPQSPLQDNDLTRLSGEDYSAVFLSMYDISAYSEEDFALYRGLTTVKCECPAKDLSTLNKYLETAFSSANNLQEVYLGLDPAMLFAGSKDLSAELKNTLLPYIQNHPECTFEILLPYPSLATLRGMNREELDNARFLSTSFAGMLPAVPNCKVYCVGGEEWLIANPGNYVSGNAVNAHVAQKLFLLTFCDGQYEVDSSLLSADLEKVLPLRDKKYPSADLSGRTFVFFGDSIFGNYTGSTSVPGVVSGLSDATVYNLAKGGATGADYHDAPANFTAMAKAFKDGDTDFLAGEQCALELSAFLSDAPEGDLCFVVNFGLNDYFNGTPVTGENSYEEGLIEGIKILKEARPDADILLVAPTFCATFSNGTEVNSSEGGLLRDYADKALQIAEELHIRAVDPYTELGVDEDNSEDYLSDETHFNEAGRFLFGEYLTEKLAD